MADIIYTKADELTLRITRTRTEMEDISIAGLKNARVRREKQLAALEADYAERRARLLEQIAAIDAQIIEAGKLGIVEQTGEVA